MLRPLLEGPSLPSALTAPEGYAVNRSLPRNGRAPAEFLPELRGGTVLTTVRSWITGREPCPR